MMTPKALAALRRDYTQAQKHLDFLERMAAIPKDQRPIGILLATADMIVVARQKVVDLGRLLLDNAEQLELFV